MNEKRNGNENLPSAGLLKNATCNEAEVLNTSLRTRKREYRVKTKNSWGQQEVKKLYIGLINFKIKAYVLIRKVIYV